MLHLPTREGLLYRWKLYIAYKKDIVAGPVELMVIALEITRNL
jgi:hypothetical protein